MKQARTHRTFQRQRVKLLRLLALLALSLLLAACATSKRDDDLQKTMRSYNKMIRFSQFDAALKYHDPEYMAEHPVSNLEMNRLALYRVTGYEAVSSEILEDGNAVRQRVIITLYNSSNPRERSITQEQYWRYNPEREQWLLHSPLPNPLQGQPGH